MAYKVTQKKIEGASHTKVTWLLFNNVEAGIAMSDCVCVFHFNNLEKKSHIIIIIVSPDHKLLVYHS